MFIPVFFVQLYPCFLAYGKCSWAHTLSCLFVYCSFAIIGHADIMWSIVSSNCWQSLHLLSVSVLNIFVAWYFVNAWSCAATISLSVSAFRSPSDSQRNVSSSLMSCICNSYVLPMHYLVFPFFFKTSLKLAFLCCVPSLFT